MPDYALEVKRSRISAGKSRITDSSHVRLPRFLTENRDFGQKVWFLCLFMNV
jgi:hypothetical protein